MPLDLSAHVTHSIHAAHVAAVHAPASVTGADASHHAASINSGITGGFNHLSTAGGCGHVSGTIPLGAHSALTGTVNGCMGNPASSAPLHTAITGGSAALTWMF